MTPGIGAAKYFAMSQVVSLAWRYVGRDELLDREIFYTLTEAQILIERWRQQYNTVRPHSALGYRPLAQPRSSRPHSGA